MIPVPVLSIFGSMILIAYFGMREGKHVRSLKDFAFSKGAFGTFSLVATISASFIGGGVVIGTAEKSYLLGLAPVIGLLGFSFQLFLTGQFVAKRIYRQENTLSIGELLAKKYGQKAKILVGFSWTLFCVGLLAAQMLALGRILSLFVPISPQLSNLLASSFLILYCMLGGIRAVVITDRLQFCLIMLIVPALLACLIVLFVRSNESFQSLPANFLNPLAQMNFSQLLSLFLSFLLGDALIPPVIQRVQIAKNYFQAKKALIISACIVALFTFICGGLGIMGLLLEPGLQASQLIPTLFNQFFSAPFQIFGVIAILAVLMSTADSYLNSLAFTFVTDVYKPLTKKVVSENKALYVARWGTFLFGFLAFFISIYGKNSYDLLLHTYKFWGPLMLMPTLYLLLDQTISRRGFYLTLLTSFVSVLIWEFFEMERQTSISALIFGIAVSFVVYNSFLLIKRFKSSLHKVEHIKT